MDSINYSHPSRLVCPTVRVENTIIQYGKPFSGVDYIGVDSSYYFYNAKDDESSHPHHLLPLFGCNNREIIPDLRFFPLREDAYCGSCLTNTIGTTYYFCKQCKKWYHKECVESPPLLKSSYHPKHSLQLCIYGRMGQLMLECSSITRFGCLIYHCSVCKFDLDPVCATKPPIIKHLKTHEHTLYYFTRKPNLICDICGENSKEFIFLCLYCDFIVHKWCIYLPRIIKVSRHKHRLSFELGTEAFHSLSFGRLFCGVCRQKIDEKYGAYSCMTKDCIYAVHVRCATRRDIWDGKELEGEPEEVKETIKPSFEKISDGIIQHFSHPIHPMRLEEDAKTWYNEEKYCQACIVPIYDGKAYLCMECNYVLHEACAYLPRVKQHVLHVHPLAIQSSRTLTNCNLCHRDSFGFKYVCYNIDCNNFSVDVRCVSIDEPHEHHSHSHSLFYSSDGVCWICRKGAKDMLTCVECTNKFVLCFECATLPYKMRYKNDDHILTISYGTNQPYWCDYCENSIDDIGGFYKCNECEVTIHIQCLLGNDLYMNPGLTIEDDEEEYDIVLNISLTRPICKRCQKRCEYKVMFIASSGDIYCSIAHIYGYN